MEGQKMGLYADWLARCEQPGSEAQRQQYWSEYFAAETENYRRILASGQTVYEGPLSELAAAFSMEPVVFCGFLDGANTSFVEPLELETLEETTPLHLEFDLEKLYYNMLAAKADWLFHLPEWEGRLSAERRREITKEYRTAQVYVKEKTVGRNDPCPCGSGKKYKKCCGRG